MQPGIAGQQLQMGQPVPQTMNLVNTRLMSAYIVTRVLLVTEKHDCRVYFDLHIIETQHCDALQVQG